MRAEENPAEGEGGSERGGCTSAEAMNYVTTPVEISAGVLCLCVGSLSHRQVKNRAATLLLTPLLEVLASARSSSDFTFFFLLARRISEATLPRLQLLCWPFHRGRPIFSLF